MTPFRSAGFRWLWCSTLGSSSAQGFERTATAWLALEAGGPVAVGMVLAARMAPSLLFGLAAGTIADRHDRRLQIVAVGGAALPLMAAVAWLIGSAAVQTWQVVAIAFVTGCLQVFDTPARQALVLDTVGHEAAPNAVALNACGARLATALGAFAGGVFIAWLGVAFCYLAVGVGYGLAALLVMAVRVTRDHPFGFIHPPFLRSLVGAARLVVDVPAVRTLLMAGVAVEIFAFSHLTALPILARDVLAAGPQGLGTLNAAASIGGMVAVVFLSLLPGRVRREPLLSLVFLLFGASIVTLGLSRGLVAAAAVLVVIGACGAAFDVLQQTLLQMAVPAAQRGRAVGIWVLGLGSAPLGHLEMGLVASALGAPGGLIINGSLVVVGAAILLARAPSFRWTAWARR